MRVEIDLGDSGLAYTPGDALGVHAQNSSMVSILCCRTVPK